MSRLHPGSAKPVVALPLIVLTVAVFAIAPCCFIFIDRSYATFSMKYAVEQSAKAYKENRFDEAATILERLSVTHKLADDERALLNDIYLARADSFAVQQNYAAGLADLARISPGYGKFLLVNQKQHEFGELLKKQQSAGVPAKIHHSAQVKTSHPALPIAVRAAQHRPIDSPKPTASTPPSFAGAPRRASEITSTAASQPSIAIAPPRRSSNIVNAPNEAPQSPAPAHRTPEAVKASVPPAETSVVVAPPRRSANAIAAPSPAPQAATSVRRRKYAESEVVRYNELLAAYFSQDHKATVKPAEPPSLKEWIDLGKPSF